MLFLVVQNAKGITGQIFSSVTLSKCNQISQIDRKLQIYSHLLENFLNATALFAQRIHIVGFNNCTWRKPQDAVLKNQKDI